MVAYFKNRQALLAIILFSASVLLITLMNGLVKLISDQHPPVEIMFYRGVIAMALLLVWALYRGKIGTIYKTAHPAKHFGRGLVGNIGMFLVMWSFALLPMADVTATLFSGTLMATALSALILKEKVGAWRWGAVIAGFIGIVMIINPAHLVAGGYERFIPLLAALFGAFVHIYLRELGKTEDSLTTVFYFLLFGIVLSALYMPFNGHWPTGTTLLPLVGIAVCGVLSLVLKSEAFAMAEASLLSPFNYSAIVWSTLIGWLAFGDIPTPLVITGAVIVIASNIVILYREQMKKKSY